MVRAPGRAFEGAQKQRPLGDAAARKPLIQPRFGRAPNTPNWWYFVAAEVRILHFASWQQKARRVAGLGWG